MFVVFVVMWRDNSSSGKDWEFEIFTDKQKAYARRDDLRGLFASRGNGDAIILKGE